MKIVHIAPKAPYNDYWGYHENLLPKYHKKLGHDVTLIVTNTMHSGGKIIEIDCDDYILNDGVRVIRLYRKQYIHRVLTSVNSYLPVFEYLREIKPDFIFYHGMLGKTIFDVVKYKKEINLGCTIVQDNHMDYYNAGIVKDWKEKLFRAYYRYITNKTLPYINKVYGVTPWRKMYAIDYFKVPDNKVDVLVMGADDDKIDIANKNSIRKKIREQYGIKDSEFFIVTGGKIDKSKNIHLLMKACAKVGKTKLLVFGTVNDDLKDEFNAIINSTNNIIYIGWLEADKVYDYFMAAELVCFPGTHSVMWEQACACKVPCLFEQWEGMEHVNNGGNSDFISPVDENTLCEKIIELLYTDKYYKMKYIAESNKTDIFKYSKIAEKSLECVSTK